MAAGFEKFMLEHVVAHAKQFCTDTFRIDVRPPLIKVFGTGMLNTRPWDVEYFDQCLEFSIWRLRPSRFDANPDVTGPLVLVPSPGAM